MEIPAKNTMGLSIKKVTFTSVERENRHLSYNFTLFHFFFLTHKDHTKTFTTSQKSKFMRHIYFFAPQNSENKSRGLYFSKALFEGLIFGRAYVRGEICVSKSIEPACSGKEIYHYWFVLLCIRGQFQVQVPRVAYIRRGDLTEGFLRYDFQGLIHGGAYFRNFTVRYSSLSNCICRWSQGRTSARAGF